MAQSQLMTNWICIATEGETVDKRFLTREMLIDAAETYDPNLYTALLWPEHERWAGNAGEVLEVQAAEDDTNLVKLYARLCPSTDLIYANRNGKLLFSSVELTPDGDFRGTGRYYLEGLGITDSPASVGTTRMRFNKREDNYFIGNSLPLVINEVREIDMAKEKKTWHSLFGIKPQKFAEETPPEETPPEDGDKLQALAQALTDLETRVSALEGQVDTVAEVVDTEEFASLRDNLPVILKNFNKLDNKVTTLPSRNPGDNKKFKFL